MAELPFRPSSGEPVMVSREIVSLMRSIGTMLKDLGYEETIPSEPISIEVKGPIFEKKHLLEPGPKLPENQKKLELQEWERSFCQTMDNLTFFHLICAANFLDMKPLLDVTLLFLAMKLRSMSPEAIRREYGITQVFSEEDMEKAKKDFEEIILTTVSKK